MAPKAKKNTAAAAAQEPPAKKAKAEEPAKKEEPKKEEPKKEEPQKEEVKEEEKKYEEPDAPKDNRAAVKETVSFSTTETTLNVVPTMGGSLLTTITEGAMSYLLAGARANVGLKGGRYMFEAKILQHLGAQGDTRCKPLLRIGFSTAGSSLFLGEDEKSVCFDCDGGFTADKKRTALPQKARIFKEKTVAVVLNLDQKSPNANTINLYIDGEKITEPKPLPEALKGQPLFPTLTYRSLSVQVNFGPTPLQDLPFKCRMLQGAANSDVTVVTTKEPKDGKYEVLLPVAFPDEGTFDWLDIFLENNPKYVELSDRKIAQWCKSSGVVSKGSNAKASNDKPVGNYGVPGLDDFTVRKVINSVAPCVPRNYLIMEVKANLVAAERRECLKKFNYPCFKKVAHVVMGKPDEEYKKMVHSKILKEKQEKALVAWKLKKEAEARKKAVEKKQKEIAKQKKEAEKKRKAEIEAKKKAKDGEEAKKEDEPMEEEEEKEEEDKDTEPPAVELTEEEKAKVFLTKSVPDLAPLVMNAFFAKFTTPEKDEGFDDIRYEWEKGDKADAYLKEWVLNKKLTTRIDGLQPGQFFKDKVAEFEKVWKEWQEKQKAAKPPKKVATEEEEPEIDIHSVENICDAGEGVPLFSNFAAEDWELTKSRFEFAALITSFKKDCNDPDREGIPLDHLSFYFQRYFRKAINFKMYGLTEEKEIFTLIKDTVTPKNSMLTCQLSDGVDSLDMFVKLTEEQRRERQRRIDAGDETARLKFTPPPKHVEKQKPETKAPEAKKQEAKAEDTKKPEAKAAPKHVPAPKAKESKEAPKMVPAPKLGTSKGKGKGKW